MAKLLKLRRGTTSQHSSFTGAEGEVTVDTDKETLVVHDGSTAGGHPVAAEDLANVSSGTIVGRLGSGSIAGAKIANDAIDSQHYTDGSIDRVHLSGDIIDGSKIADDSINSEHYVDGSIDDVHLANSAVARSKIAPDAVDGTKIADDSIDSEHYVNASIDAAHIANNTITAAQLAGDSVGNSEIQNDAVTYAKIQNIATGDRVLGRASNSGDVGEVQVTNGMIAAGTIQADRLASNTITASQLAANSVGSSEIAANAVGTSELANDSVDHSQIKANAVQEAKIATNAVTETKIASNSVTAAKIASNAVVGGKIANDSIDSQHYVDGSIDDQHIANQTITAAKIALNTIGTAQIATAGVGTDELAGDCVTAAKIADDQVQAEHIGDSAINEARLQISNSGSNGQFLQKQSGNTGGLTWADSSGLFESYAMIEDRKSDGTNGGTFSSGAWRTRDLNHEVTDPDGIVSISSNVFALSGSSSDKYLVRWRSPAYKVDVHGSRIYCTTDSNVAAKGSASVCKGNYGIATTISHGMARLDGGKSYRIEAYAWQTISGDGFGSTWSASWCPGIYAQVEIMKEG
jgi:hypothetical protein